MIDADPQGNLTTWLAPENAGTDLPIVIGGRFNPEDAIYPADVEKFKPEGGGIRKAVERGDRQ